MNYLNTHELEQWLLEDFPSDIDTDIEMSDDDVDMGKCQYEILRNSFFNFTDIFY